MKCSKKYLNKPKTLNDEYENMTEINSFKPLLNVYLIWHPSADSFCEDLAKSVFSHLNRDADKPFARSIAIPTYYRCVPELNKNAPLSINIDNAKHTVMRIKS